jgi:hypothetical protein
MGNKTKRLGLGMRRISVFSMTDTVSQYSYPQILLFLDDGVEKFLKGL